LKLEKVAPPWNNSRSITKGKEPLMRLDTKKRKKATRGFESVYGREKLIDQMFQIFCKGKHGLDAFLLEIGRMMAETIMPACAFARRQVH
jgi:hypothetical protein